MLTGSAGDNWDVCRGLKSDVKDSEFAKKQKPFISLKHISITERISQETALIWPFNLFTPSHPSHVISTLIVYSHPC